MKKKLIRENVQLAHIKINQLKTLKLKIEEIVIPAFDELQVGQFKTELLNDILNGEGDIIKSMVQRQAEHAINEMKSPSVRKTILANVERSFIDFQKVCEKVSNFKGIELLTFNRCSFCYDFVRC